MKQIYFSRHAKKQMKWRNISEDEVRQTIFIMKIEYDQEVDVLYIRIQKTEVFRTQEVEEGINLDFDEDSKIIGLEIIGAKERYNKKDIFTIETENLTLDQGCS